MSSSCDAGDERLIELLIQLTDICIARVEGSPLSAEVHKGTWSKAGMRANMVRILARPVCTQSDSCYAYQEIGTSS